TRLDVEGGVELVQVAYHRVAPDLVRGVRVDRQQPQRLLVPGLGTPRARPGDEQPLHVGQAIDGLTGAAALAGEGDPVRLDGDTQTTDIADVLADGECAVDVLGAVELAGGELVVLGAAVPSSVGPRLVGAAAGRTVREQRP